MWKYNNMTMKKIEQFLKHKITTNKWWAFRGAVVMAVNQQIKNKNRLLKGVGFSRYDLKRFKENGLKKDDIHYLRNRMINSCDDILIEMKLE